MKVQTLNENLIKALSGIKENQVSICNILLSRRLLLEILKTNKDCGLVEIETGKTTWLNNDVRNRDSLQFKMDKTTIRLFGKEYSPYNTKCLNPAKLDFTCSTSRQGIPVKTLELIDALNYVMPCIASEQDRPALQCVLFESNHDTDTLKLVTADGYRLAKIALKVTGIPTDKVLIEREDINKLYSFLKAVQPIGKGKSKTNPDVNVLHDYKTLKFTSDNSAIELERQDYQFPDYEHLIPTTDNIKVEFVASDLLKAVKSVAISARNSSGIVRLQFVKIDELTGKIAVSAKSEEISDSSTDIDAKITLGSYRSEYTNRIALNSKYLIDLLSLHKNEIITAKTMGDTYPMLFESPNHQCILMPMLVTWDKQTDKKHLMESINKMIESNPIESEELSDEPEDLEVYLNEHAEQSDDTVNIT